MPTLAAFLEVAESAVGAPLPLPPVQVEELVGLREWMMDGLHRAGEEEKMTMLRGFYELWITRNNAREGRMLEDQTAIRDRVLYLSDEWKSIHESVERTTTNSVDAHWSRPESG